MRKKRSTDIKKLCAKESMLSYMKQTGAVLVVMMLCIVGARADHQLHVIDAWARATVPTAKVGATYFVVHNRGDSSDRLVRLESTVANKTEMHTSTMHGDLMKMERLDSVRVIANGHTVFEPGGHHVMLMGLREPLVEGDAFPLTLIFENAGPVEVMVTVRSIDFMEQDDQHHDNHSSHDISQVENNHSHTSE